MDAPWATAGTILTTHNGGRTWAAQNSGTTERLYGVDFVDANVGWAVGEGPYGGSATILKTTDGGATWTAEASDPTYAALHSVTFIDASTGWAVGKDLWGAMILKTTNGGHYLGHAEVRLGGCTERESMVGHLRRRGPRLGGRARRCREWGGTVHRGWGSDMDRSDLGDCGDSSGSLVGQFRRLQHRLERRGGRRDPEDGQRRLGLDCCEELARLPIRQRREAPIRGDVHERKHGLSGRRRRSDAENLRRRQDLVRS